MNNEEKRHLSIISLIVFIICCFFCVNSTTAKAAENEFSYVFLSSYEEVIDIGDEFYLLAWTSNNKKPTWKSSDSKIASVNTYGLVTGKRAGTVKITAKISGAEMSCTVKVNKTVITVDKKSLSLEHNESVKLKASTSNGSLVVWKSSKKSVALVDDQGQVLALKPGEALITASADGTSVTCKVTVKQPRVTLNKTSVTLYRGQTVKLSAAVSSNIAPTWKSNKKSVAFIDENGNVTAVKHGIAVITAKVDGTSRICQVTVEQPEITLSHTELDIKAGETAQLQATVSSNNPVTWSVSNQNVASISNDGTISTYKKGTCYVYAKEDGVKVKCVVHVL